MCSCSIRFGLTVLVGPKYILYGYMDSSVLHEHQARAEI